VGTSTDDAELVALETDHITGLPTARGGSGDPSPMTAWGVFCGMRAAAAEAGLGDDLRGIRVAVQGAGHVGAGLVRHLLDAGADVTVSDIYPERVEALAELGAKACPPDEIHRQDCDVFAPCALGAVIRPETVGELRCRVVAGAANNQLLDSSMGDVLHSRSIVYAPDFVINAGGVINIAEELGRPYDAERARASVERIADTLTAVFERSRRDGIAPHVAADRLAEERIAAARASRPDAVAALHRPG
jgi:leucine dehydrogenase